MIFWYPKYSNCLLWSLYMLVANGGYIVFRRSNFGWWPHALYSKDLIQFLAYVPLKRLDKCDRWKIPPVIFKGEVIYNAM